VSGDHGLEAVLRLGTRASPLALVQANLVRDAILALDDAPQVELVELVSDGDRDPRELRDIGERGIFAAHLERELLAGSIDAAVHSSKDLTLEDHPELVLAAWPERDDPRDALVGTGGLGISDLPPGASLATGSARRAAQLHSIRADLLTVPIRGNVRTRIDRSRERGDAGCVLAMAGLHRLGFLTETFDVTALQVEQFVPEAGQGAIVVQTRAHVCARTGFDWSRVDHVATRRTVTLEREIARMLGGGCSTPVGVHVELDAARVHAFAQADAATSGRQARHDVLGLELAPLLSVSAATDIDDAVHSIAPKLTRVLAEQLGIEQVQA
jgi:hydroxymethylbilane synthase